jgi:hypothetical protein
MSSRHFVKLTCICKTSVIFYGPDYPKPSLLTCPLCGETGRWWTQAGTEMEGAKMTTTVNDAFATPPLTPNEES